MAKNFETFQRDKTLTANGGAGSLIQTKDNGSVLVLPFDEWEIYKHPDKMQVIQDSRLCKLLRDQGYINIKEIFSIPENEPDSRRPYIVANNDKLLCGKYFPEWFFCPQCRKFMPLSEWRKAWNSTFNTSFDRDYPCCYHCKETRKRKVRLEQVRFILIDKTNGDMKDIPWNKYVQTRGATLEYNENKDTSYGLESLEYSTSGSAVDLSGINVRQGNKRRSLVGLFEMKFIIDGKEYNAAIRGMSGIYLPKRVSSIYVPIEQPSPEDLEMLRSFRDMSGSEQFSIAYLAKKNYHHPELMFKRLQASNFELRAYAEDMIDFRKEEYDYITSGDNESDPDLVRYPLDGFAEIQEVLDLFRQIYVVKKLKETSLLLGYKRGNNDCKLHDCCKGEPRTIEYYPAVEEYGEGIFFQMDVRKLYDWLGKGLSEECLLKESKVFMHSLSHAIMKELESECGYQLTSIRERLYFEEKVSEEPYLGFMIYCINGEASLGGMTDYVAPKLKALLFNAITRGAYCPHDPICENERGHCFACLDIPEISCDGEMNGHLDRKYMKRLNEYIQKRMQQPTTI